MKLFFLENESSVEPLLGAPGYMAGRDQIVCLNWLVMIRLAQAGKGHRYLFGDALLTQEDLQSLSEKIDDISAAWFKPGGKDLTVVNGISIGELAVGMPVRLYFAGILLKYGEILRQAIVRWPKIECVVHDLSGGGISAHQWADENGETFNKSYLVETVAAQLGLPCTFLAPPRPLRSAFMANRGSKGRPQSIGRRWLRTALQASFDLLNRVVRRVRPMERRIYLFPYANNQGTLLAHLDPSFILRPMSPRQMLHLLRRGPTFLDFSWRAPPAVSLRGHIELLRHLCEQGAADPTWRRLFVHCGVDYFAALKPALSAIVSRELPALGAFTESVRRHLRRERIATLVLNDTLDERNRAVVAACRAEGARSIFVDHGIMGLWHGLKACDRAEPDIVISPGTFDPYRHSMATLPMGNPCMDMYAPGIVRPIKEIRRVLFLSFEDNFYARFDRFAYQEKYYEEMFSIFAVLADEGMEISYKPHPGEDPEYHRYLMQFFNVDESRIRYVQSLPFSDVVKEVDLVVSNVTSCYYEAQAAGVPTVFLEPVYVPAALCPPLNGENGCDVLRVSSGAELLDLIRKCRSDPVPLLDNLRRFLRDQAPIYMGPIDGSVAKRVLNELVKLHSGRFCR